MNELPSLEVEYRGLRAKIEPAAYSEFNDKFRWEIRFLHSRDYDWNDWNDWKVLGINLYYPDISVELAKAVALQALNTERKNYICYLETQKTWTENKLAELAKL